MVPARRRQIEASLQGVDAAAGANIKLDEEGGARAVTPKTNIILPAIDVLLALGSLDGLDGHHLLDPDFHQGPDLAGGAVRGGAGFKLVGTVIGLAAHYRPISAGFAFYGANQFCLKQGGVGSFEAETGAVTHLADSLSSWAKLILSEFEFHTGHPLARDWQLRNRPLRLGERLVPKMPFVTGGDYAIENLVAVEALRGMRFRGDLAVQIRDLPDGTQIHYSVV